jgi:FAD/FMN-containing dehydrogenase
MNRMDPVDLRAHTVRVQAGAITQSVHEHCAHHGLTWPVDFASKGSSHVGGNISTNAGGVRVIRYGLTRSWVLGLQVVLMNGEILELNGALEKNNTGVDLRQLFIGSEGTLGVITEATLKLTRLARAPEVFFFALQDLPAVLELFKLARTGPFEVQAFECLSRNCLEAVVQSRKLRAPFEKEAPIYVLLEIERPEKEDVQSVLTEWLEGLFDRGLVLDGTWAQSPRDAREIWQLREGIAEALANRGLLHKNDVSVPVAELEGFIPDLEKLFHESFPDWEVFIFGHIGDGNLHINAIQPGGVDKKVFLDKCGIVDQSLFSLVQKYRGSVSAEHGIGLLKKSALSYSRTPAELAIFRGIKQVLDPLGLMNPGKIFDMD